MNAKILLKYSEGKCTLSEVAEVEELLQHSAEARAIVKEYKELLALSRDIEYLEAIDYTLPLQDIKAIIKQEKKKIVLAALTKVAAVLMFPLLASSLLMAYLLLGTNEKSDLYTEITANPGTIIQHVLPDKSVVWLNSGTKLRYPNNYSSKNRSVDLVDGEAFFDVEASRVSPFYVNTSSGVSMYVYGTRFNVKNIASDSIIETVLEKGKLNVLVENNDQEIELLPGEIVKYNKLTSQIEKKEIDVWEKTAWCEGKLVFRNASLKTILDRLAVHFDIDIEYVNHTGVDHKYRATFTHESLQQILIHLSKSAKITWEEIDNESEKEKIKVESY